MIIEERCYTIQPGKVNVWLEHYEKTGWPVQQKHLGRCIGFFVTEIGTLNQVVHLWQYDNLAHREQARAAMVADPDWALYIKDNPPVIISQESRVMKPTSFSPLR